MSLKAILWALEEAPVDDPASALILVALADRASDDGSDAYPSREWLATRGRCSVSTVARRLKKLEESGVIRRGNQALLESKSIPPDRRPIVYDLALDRRRVRLTGGSTGRNDVSTGLSDVSTGRNDVSLVTHKPSFNPPEPSNNLPSRKPVRDDVRAVCDHLSERIKKNALKKNTGNITNGWYEDARKLIDIDGVKPEIVHAIIDWCQNDPFWKGNILSMKKLREKFDQLALKAESQGVNLQHGSKFRQLLDDGNVTALDSLAADKALPPWRDDLNWMGHESELEIRRLKVAWWSEWWEREGKTLL